MTLRNSLSDSFALDIIWTSDHKHFIMSSSPALWHMKEEEGSFLDYTLQTFRRNGLILYHSLSDITFMLILQHSKKLITPKSIMERFAFSPLVINKYAKDCPDGASTTLSHLVLSVIPCQYHIQQRAMQILRKRNQTGPSDSARTHAQTQAHTHTHTHTHTYTHTLHFSICHKKKQTQEQTCSQEIL